VQTDEETIDQLSFPAWRRVATRIQGRKGSATQVVTVVTPIGGILQLDELNHGVGGGGLRELGVFISTRMPWTVLPTH
jgi:hypothetical protein